MKALYCWELIHPDVVGDANLVKKTRESRSLVSKKVKALDQLITAIEGARTEKDG